METLQERWSNHLAYTNEVTPDVDKMIRLKIFRNVILSHCDWVGFSSTLTPEEKEEGEVFMQALKDLPQNYETNPDEAVFPVVPSFLEMWVIL